jgi:hypothetical protein
MQLKHSASLDRIRRDYCDISVVLLNESEDFMRKALVMVPFLFSVAAFAADNTIVDRWASAVGGREKVAAVKSTYREATIEVGGFTGTIKAWHSADGRYRKEEQVGMYSTVEIFDGTNGTLQQGAAPPRRMEGAELERARSTPSPTGMPSSSPSSRSAATGVWPSKGTTRS